MVKGFFSYYVIFVLIDMNVKCGYMERVVRLFEEMFKWDFVLYCLMMEGMGIYGCGGEVVWLFERMVEEGIVFDSVVFIVILKVCS